MTLLIIMSYIRPGVPTIMWGRVVSKSRMHLPVAVPPITSDDLILLNLDNPVSTECDWIASSLVGDRIRTWRSLLFSSANSIARLVTSLPPDCAWAIKSRRFH